MPTNGHGYIYGGIHSGSETRAGSGFGPDPVPWSPFTNLAVAAPEVGTSVAAATSKALMAKRAALEACFPPQTAAAVRAMIVVKPDGSTSARVGGAGSATIESCVRDDIAGLNVSAPSHSMPVEIACDAMRGLDPTWRVTPAAPYTVIEVDNTVARSGSNTWSVDSPPPPKLSLSNGGIYLVIVDADTALGSLSAFVFNLETMHSGLIDPPAIIAMRATTGPPYFAYAIGGRAPEIEDPRQLGFRISDHRVERCDTAGPPAAAARTAALDALVAAGVASCHGKCSVTTVYAGTAATMSDLVALTSRLRRSGIDRIRFNATRSPVQWCPPVSP